MEGWKGSLAGSLTHTLNRALEVVGGGLFPEGRWSFPQAKMESLGYEESKQRHQHEKEPEAGRCSTSLGSTQLWGDGASQQCLWPRSASRAGVPPPRPPSPEHLPQLSVLGGTRGGRDTASTFDRAGGPHASALQALPPLPPGKPGKDTPASYLSGGSLIPVSSYIIHQSCSEGQSALPTLFQSALAMLAGLRCPG